MKIIKKSEIKKFKNSNDCSGLEYPLNNKDIDFSIIKIKGRYPDKNFVINLKCKELVFVVKGNGKIFIENKEILIEKEDVILIEPKEKYFFNGKMKLIILCNPAWYSQQHKLVK